MTRIVLNIEAETVEEVSDVVLNLAGRVESAKPDHVCTTTEAAIQQAEFTTSAYERCAKERDAAIGDTAQARTELTEARQELKTTQNARDEARRTYERIAAHRDELIDQVRDLTHARDEAESQAETYGEHLKAITVAFAKAQNLDSRQIAVIEAAADLFTHTHAPS